MKYFRATDKTAEQGFVYHKTQSVNRALGVIDRDTLFAAVASDADITPQLGEYRVRAALKRGYIEYCDPPEDEPIGEMQQVKIDDLRPDITIKAKRVKGLWSCSVARPGVKVKLTSESLDHALETIKGLI